jgi:hypothetical protein
MELDAFVVTTLVVFIFHLFYFGKFVFTFSIRIVYIYLDLFIYNQNNSAFGLQVRRSWS